jgi:two-component system alkaline phosphatase synthesis response regulator PhoP
MMPEMDGWELCRILRRNEEKEIRDTGILVLTARAMEEDRIYGLRIGADDYLTKPFSVGELTARVDKLVARRRDRDRRAASLSQDPN